MFADAIPPYLYWDCPNGDFLTEVITNQYAWVWLLWLLSQTWITLHIWTPKCERLATTEKLFVNPFYCSLLIDQSMGMNRRRDDESDVKTEDIELERDGVADTDMTQYYETISIGTESSTATPKTVKASDSITRIYTCATMWHETTEEMLTFLKSIFHMDEDQSARRVAQKYLKVNGARISCEFLVLFFHLMTLDFIFLRLLLDCRSGLLRIRNAHFFRRRFRVERSQRRRCRR